MKSLKLKIFTGENIKYCCTENLFDTQRLESSGTFKTGSIGYITYVFEDTFDSILCFGVINKYKQVTYFINKLCVCDMDVIPPDELTTYESLVKEATRQ